MNVRKILLILLALSMSMMLAACFESPTAPTKPEPKPFGILNPNLQGIA
jgi:starvation-inducible outer membrane lipoprotein